MGEYAEMMLDGTMCASCGEFIHQGEAEGFPRYCSSQCARDAGAFMPEATKRERAAELQRRRDLSKPRADKTNCPHCKKRLKIAGLADHVRDAHPETQI